MNANVKLAKLVLQMQPWLLEFRTSCGKVASKQVGEACDELVAKWSARSVWHHVGLRCLLLQEAAYGHAGLTYFLTYLLAYLLISYLQVDDDESGCTSTVVHRQVSEHWKRGSGEFLKKQGLSS